MSAPLDKFSPLRHLSVTSWTLNPSIVHSKVAPMSYKQLLPPHVCLRWPFPAPGL